MDPYGECGVSASLRALTEAGRRADALDVYDQYRRALAGELGLDPERELVELQGQVLRGHPYWPPTGRSTVTERALGRRRPPPPSLSLWHQVGSRLGIEIPTGAVTDVRAAFTTVETPVRAVLAAVRDRPTLLVLDDVQRTDDASVQVLQGLAGELWGAPLAILATRQFHGRRMLYIGEPGETPGCSTSSSADPRAPRPTRLSRVASVRSSGRCC